MENLLISGWTPDKGKPKKGSLLRLVYILSNSVFYLSFWRVF